MSKRNNDQSNLVIFISMNLFTLSNKKANKIYIIIIIDFK